MICNQCFFDFSKVFFLIEVVFFRTNTIYVVEKIKNTINFTFPSISKNKFIRTKKDANEKWVKFSFWLILYFK